MSEPREIKCACVSRDAGECSRHRHNRLAQPFWDSGESAYLDDEHCECPCHDGDEDEDEHP